MSEPVSRLLYRWLLRLHPAEFRREFSEEMLWIFDEVAAVRSMAPLFADVTASLARQWMMRTWHGAESGEVVPADNGVFAWEHVALPEAGLPLSRMVQGGAVALVFMAVLSFAAFRPVPRRAVTALAGGGGNRDWRAESWSAAVASGNANSEVQTISRARESATSMAWYSQRENSYPAFSGSGSHENGAESMLILRGAPAETDKDGGFWTAQAQAVPASTPAEQQFKAWLMAFNEGDKAKFQAFLEKNYPEGAKRIDGVMGFRRMTGGFDFKKVEKSDANTFVGIVKERDSDTFARFEIQVDAAGPHKIIQLDLEQIPAPAEFALPRMSEEQAIAALRAEIEKRVAADSFSGSVMVTKNGKTVFSGAYGLSDREKKTKNELNTQFRIGSMNKMFTAVSTLQLVQSGKLKLTGAVGEYLPDYPNKDVATKVTIHHLLTHTGGTGDFFGPEFDKHRLELKTLQDYIKLYGQRGLAFEPGSKWDYSNYGFLLLGVIVSKVSAQDYYDYVREHVFVPAGMTSTDSLPEEQTVSQRSVGYSKMGGETWKPNTDTLPYRGTSAGGGYSTVEDLQRFAEALRNHKLLDAKYTEMLTTGKVETGGGAKYAYGFMDQTAGGVRSYGHGGGAPGMNGDLTIYPQSGYVVTVLANIDPPAAQRIAAFIGNRLPEK